MKNPYELRYEIYNTAKERLMDKYYQDNSEWQSFHEWKRDRELNGEKITSVSAINERPSFPTHEEILVEANKIYGFVQQQ
tara:strand:- start:4875 stop:5114 length:240 start_codon:yes stop_codon:yes gene_type:complete